MNNHHELVSKDDELCIYLDRSAQHGEHCQTLSIGLHCPDAAQYNPRAKYNASCAWTCGAAAAADDQEAADHKQAAQGRRHCCQHWFSQFVCCAASGEPVAIAHNTLQLAQLLRVRGVRLLDAASSELLQEPPWGPQPPAAAAGTNSANGAMEVDDAPAPAAATAAAAGSYSRDGSSLTLRVPRPTGNWNRVPCAALFLVLDAASASSFEPGTRHTVLQCCRCGNEAGHKVTCGKHKASRIFVMAANGDVLGQPACLPLLAQLLGVQQVALDDELRDLQAKLQDDPNSEDATAAAAAGRQERGQKRGVDDDVPLSPQSLSKVAAGPQPPPASAGPALLRLHLTPQQAAAAQQAVAMQQQRQQKPALRPKPWQDIYERQVEALRLQRLQQGVVDTRVEVAAGTCAKQPCLGITLRLGVNSVQELALSGGPIPVDGGRRCSNEGGLKTCCKQHRVSLFVLTDMAGGSLPGAAHLAGLADMLKVARVELLDLARQEPLQEYLAPPPVPTWQTAADNSRLAVWLPKPTASGARQCAGLDVVVALPQGQVHSMGSQLPVVGVVTCSNDVGGRAACRRHAQGLFHIMQQGTNNAFQVCSSLGELAIWLGVGRVVVLDAASHEPLSQYLLLADPPVQLSMPSSAGQQQSGAALLPPSLVAPPPTGWPAAAAASADATGSRGPVGAAAAGMGPQLGPGGGNCLFEVLDGGGGLVVRVEGRPVGAWQRNACRSLDLVLQLAPGSRFVPGQPYRVVSVQRCPNEAGARTRCRHHMDGAAQLTGALQLLDSSNVAAAAPKLSVLARANSSQQLAHLLGLQSVLLLDKASGEELGQLEAWSPSTTSGGAAKVQLQQQQQPKEAAGAAGVAAVFLPAGLTLPLLGSSAGPVAAVSEPQQQQQQQVAAALPREQELQQRLQQLQQQQAGALSREATPASATLASAVAPGSPAALAAAAAAAAQQVPLLPLPETSRLGLYCSSDPVVQGAAPGTGLASLGAALADIQEEKVTLQSSAIAARIAGGEAPAAAAPGGGANGDRPAFTTSAPILRLAAAFSTAANS